MLKLLRLFAIVFGLVVAAGILGGGAAYWLDRDAFAPGPLAAEKTLVIPPRGGLAGIAGQLAHDGVIRHELTFEALAVLSGRRHALHPGEYAFPPRTSVAEALALIAEGHTVRHKLTIPEGLTSPQIVALVKAAPALVGDPGPVPPEGALFPDTYIYRYGDTRRALIRHMERQMAHVVGELWPERQPGLPLVAPEQAVALASIVEKETAIPAERAHVAGVYINRLRLGMRLDADPTVVFALEDDGVTKLGRKLDHADLSLASPYNTYRVTGLPPGPIDNPGRAALRAALRPEATADLYFVADGKGGHVFAQTLAEQSRNIALYLHGAAPAPDTPPPAKPPPPEPSAAPTAAPPPSAAPISAPIPPVPPPKPAIPRVLRAAARTAGLHHPCRPEPGHPCPPHLR
jgi:UPF0755 protein